MKKILLILFIIGKTLVVYSQQEECLEIIELKKSLNMVDKPFRKKDVIDGIELKFIDCIFLKNENSAKITFSFKNTKS